MILHDARVDSFAELDPEEEKEEQKALAEKFKPLIDWLKVEAKDIVRDGISFGFITSKAYIYFLLSDDF